MSMKIKASDDLEVKKIDEVRAAEKLAMDQIKGASLAPASVGSDILLVSPARGPVEAFQSLIKLPDGERDYKYVNGGFLGRDAMRESDVFDQMRAQAERSGGEFALSPVQIGVARLYRTLFERVAAAGYKCSRLDQNRVSGGGDFMDAYSRQMDALKRMIVSIGSFAILEPIGEARRLTMLELLDAVCIAQKTISQVLSDHRWINTTRRRRVLMDALSAALDRMFFQAEI